MKKDITKKLWIATFLTCFLYACISILTSLESIQKKNNNKLGQDAKAAYVCPSGYIEISDFCIQSSLQGDDDWHDAARDCAENQDARLCRSYELAAACQGENHDGISFDDNLDGGGWEWSGDMADDDNATVMFENDNNCKRMNLRNMGNSADYRCCRNRY